MRRQRQDPFRAVDWVLSGAVAFVWDGSFLLVRIGVEHLSPELVATLRLAFGSAALTVVPAARQRLPRRLWPQIAVLGLVWMAVPFVLFPAAERRIDSSLAGMLNGAVPLLTAILAACALRSLPARRRARG